MQFANNVTSPIFAGRWDLRGKKLWVPNRQPLQSWSLLILENACNEATDQAVAPSFKLLSSILHYTTTPPSNLTPNSYQCLLGAANAFSTPNRVSFMVKVVVITMGAVFRAGVFGIWIEDACTSRGAIFGASSLTGKYLIARIDKNRGQICASDDELRSLMNKS
ncbi:hypothetical protein CGRA01v4_13964 [Colletotrichum graminicola]|uniref:Uncharacterized protein n=1 Tax=Colletotrichum graminicola (strain M1.001 / M2 / FGSC 10212) TaxID=645133 RepID=E3QUQ2_COLGM|nr:uncharacterized protein GLRG_09734 [Colletotrichum graminicola M1.001]EFQ34590.1 hypothetical protein GLRG_09734 [Colletotrichum graminicola M1.001]WDK22674.1 hypothetical protein CGRA01v4_13964 [Colletotrichum graminicola]